MIYQYSHTYRKQELTDAEIYQAQVSREELQAAEKAIVNFYLDDNTGELLTICEDCFKENGLRFREITYIDKAGDWDECYMCNVQNIPSWYHGDNPNRK